MPNIRFQHVARLMIAWVLPLFVVLKTIEVRREFLLAGIPATALSVFLRGLARRLDDPSFWVVLACAVSAAFVMRAELAVGLTLAGRKKSPRFRYYVAWFTVSVAFVLIYLRAIYRNHEGFFHPSHDPAIKAVQIVESCAAITVLLLAPMFFASGLACLWEVERLLNVKPKDEPARQSAAALASAGAGPFISTSIAFLVWRAIRFLGDKLHWWHVKPDIFGLAHVTLDVVVLAFFSLPFLILLALVLLRLRRCFRFSFRRWKALPPPFDMILIVAGFGAIAVGGYYKAEWRTDAGCIPIKPPEALVREAGEA
jgi:hypothetical protein